MIAIVGAPAVGKSTLTQQISACVDASIFRLREFAQQYRIAHPSVATAFATNDAQGWLPEPTVATLIEAAFPEPLPTPVVLLENFPGTAAQLRKLVDRAVTIGASLEVVVLTASDSALAARARARRVCATCEPDLRGDPHRPAPAAVNEPDRCGQCGGQLAARRSDVPHLFEARVRRFRDHLPAIRAAAAERQISWHSVDATAEVASVVDALLDACGLIRTPTQLGASR